MLKPLTFLAAIIIATTRAVVVPKTVIAIRTMSSTTTSLSIQLDFLVDYDHHDTDARAFDLTFGSADGAFDFGFGTLNFNPRGNSTKAIAQAIWAPQAGAAADASNIVLSNFLSNKDSQIIVKMDGNTYSVVVNGIGVDMVEQFLVYIKTISPSSHPATSAAMIIVNPLALPLTVIALKATAASPSILFNGHVASLTINTLTQPEPFTISQNSNFLATNLFAETVISPQLPTPIPLEVFSGPDNLIVVNNAVASFSIKIGDYPTTLTRPVAAFVYAAALV
ncbi:hypothetical protein HDU97_004418 [Phlyctochytrium planicorne]|nr:hypothetical protein HDU97_004418 [Phlyctochytrium planicorne]